MANRRLNCWKSSERNRSSSSQLGRSCCGLVELRSVSWYARVNNPAPKIDPASHAESIGKSILSQPTRHSQGSSAVMAIHHHLISLHSLDDFGCRRPLAQRCQMRGLNIRSLIFVRFSTIKKKHRYASIIGPTIEPPLNGGNINFHRYTLERGK